MFVINSISRYVRGILQLIRMALVGSSSNAAQTPLTRNPSSTDVRKVCQWPENCRYLYRKFCQQGNKAITSADQRAPSKRVKRPEVPQTTHRMRFAYPLLFGALGVLIGLLYSRETTPPSSVELKSPLTLTLEGFAVWRRTFDAVAEFGRNLTRSTALDGKKILVTGVSSGLGFGVAARAVAAGARVVGTCRTGFCDRAEVARRIAEAAQRIAIAEGSSAPGDESARIRIEELELSDFDSVDRLVSGLSESEFRFDAIINNAGLVSPSAAPTKHGFEPTFAVNFLGAAYLIRGLINGNLLVSENSRIVTVSSEDHRAGPTLAEVAARERKPFGAPWGSGVQDAMTRYDYSKLAIATYSSALASRTKHPVLDICPGCVGTDIAANNVPYLGGLVSSLLKLFCVAPEKAAIPVLRLAVDPELEGVTGKHFHVWEERALRRDAADPKAQEWIWAATEKLLEQRSP